jgi:nucleoside-diphosphate-sugar epimerase
MRVAVTGARGFVGRFVVSELRARGAEVLALVSQPPLVADGASAVVRASDADSEDVLTNVLSGSNVVVHLAACVHDVQGRTSADRFNSVNRDYSLRLARAARRAGVERFVFLSSIKVNGESSTPDAPFRESSPVAPEGAYARSKWEAEQGLRALDAPLSRVIVRSPLVYGPGVRANFASLMRAVARRVPLPLGAVHNRRSLIYVENLASALSQLALATDPSPEPRTYLVSDREDLSTPELVRRLALALGVGPRLLPVPEPLLRLALSALGRREALPRLLGSLCVDAGKLSREHDWQPPWSVEQGLAKTAAWFRGRA